MSTSRVRLLARPAVALAVATALLAGSAGAAQADVALPPTAGAAADATAALPTLQDRAYTPTQTYIDTVYRMLFDREPDEGGLAYWTAALDSGTPRRAVVDYLTSCDEFRAGAVTNTYESILDRSPDAGGLAYWAERMRQGLTVQELQAQLMGSAESVAGAGWQEWVQTLYTQVLDRTPGADEVGFWAGALERHDLTAPQAVLGFLMSSELLTHQIGMLYRNVLHRAPDAGGVAFWVSQLQHGVRYESVVGSIIASDEFFASVNTPR